MTANYAILTEENKVFADTFIDFLAEKQKRHEQHLVSALEEYESGEAVGPFNSVEDLMADLYA